MTAEDLKAESEAGIPVWPGCEMAARLFRDLRTQWRFTNGVRAGLDYNVLYHKLDRRGLDAQEYERIEADVRVMEYAALNLFAQRRERDKRMRRQ